MIKQIVVTGDVTRPMSQKGNIETLFHLLRLPLEWTTGLPVKTITSIGKYQTMAEWSGERGDVSYSLEPSMPWQMIDHKETLVIGFEMSARMIFQAEELGIPYINVIMHPIRFMNDLVFGLKSNTGIEWPLVSEDQIKFDSGIVQAAVARLDGAGCPGNSVLIAGQFDGDRSLLHDGKTHSFKTHRETLLRIVHGRTVLYKQHPHYKTGGDPFGTALREMGISFADCSGFNIYRLMSQESIATVCALSSSVLAEAPYFGKEAIRLMPRAWWDGYAMMSAEDLINSKTWKALEKIMPVKDAPNVKTNLSESKMRKVWHAWWGYDVLR